jgi:hypothetical protein
VRGFSLGAIALLVAACGGDGVYIEVRVPAGMTVDQVDLYLATGDCRPDEVGFNCESIVPPGDSSVPRDRVEGEVYFVDDNRPFVSVPDGDGSAWFHLDPSSQFKLKTAIAVGHDLAGASSGVAIFQQIELDVTQHIRIDLEPVASKEVRGLAQPAVEVWGPTSEDYRCVAAEVQNRVVYIVPSNDPDCDEVATARECLPGVHLGQQSASAELADQSCTTSEPTGLCVLGSEGCDERNPADAGGCTTNPAAKFCVPDRACGCDTLDLACLDALFGDPLAGGGTHILCVVEVEPDIDGGTLSCKDKEIPAATIDNNIGGKTCTLPTIAALADGLPGFANSTTVQIANTDVTLKPRTGFSGCAISIDPPNAKFADGTPVFPIFTLVQVQLAQQGAPMQKSLIIPLKVVFSDVMGSCAVGVETRCTVVTTPNEHLPTCFD